MQQDVIAPFWVFPMLLWATLYWSDFTYPFHQGIALFAFLSFPQWINSSLLPGALGCPWPGHSPSDLPDVLVCEPSENNRMKPGTRASYASSPLGDFSRSPLECLSQILTSMIVPTFLQLWNFLFFLPYRDLALFFSVSLQNLALGGKSQGTERHLNTKSNSRQSSLWKLLLGHLPAYQVLWLNSSAFVLDTSILTKHKVTSSSVKRSSSLHCPLVFMPLLTSLPASTSRVINSDGSPSWPYKFL